MQQHRGLCRQWHAKSTHPMVRRRTDAIRHAFLLTYFEPELANWTKGTKYKADWALRAMRSRSAARQHPSGADCAGDPIGVTKYFGHPLFRHNFGANG